MNRQEIYDKVCNHLARQKTRAKQGNACAYRTDDGRRCAVGCLVPRHVWKKEIGPTRNNDSVDTLMKTSPWAKKNLGRNERLLQRLQIAHDRDIQSAGWLRDALANIAKRHRIKPGAEQYIRTWKP